MKCVLKLVIPLISKPMQLITSAKAMWDESDSIFGYESNISQIVEVYE